MFLQAVMTASSDDGWYGSFANSARYAVRCARAGRARISGSSTADSGRVGTAGLAAVSSTFSLMAKSLPSSRMSLRQERMN